MKKSLKPLTFGAALAGTALAAALTACHETVYGPPPETVYGPPYGETSEENAEETGQPATELPEDENDPMTGASYDPGENIVEDVYGPPMDNTGGDYEDPAEGTTVTAPGPSGVTSVDRVAPVLYGPPPEEDD